MQVFGLNGVVDDSGRGTLPQENFRIPVKVRDALVELWGRVGAKQKWAAYTAAILAFYRLTDEEQYDAMDAVAAARRRNDFRHLLIRDVGESGVNGSAKPPVRPSERSEARARRKPARSGRSAEPRERAK